MFICGGIGNSLPEFHFVQNKLSFETCHGAVWTSDWGIFSLYLPSYFLSIKIHISSQSRTLADTKFQYLDDASCDVCERSDCRRNFVYFRYLLCRCHLLTRRVNCQTAHFPLQHESHRISLRICLLLMDPLLQNDTCILVLISIAIALKQPWFLLWTVLDIILVQEGNTLMSGLGM